MCGANITEIGGNIRDVSKTESEMRTNSLKAHLKIDFVKLIVIVF